MLWIERVGIWSYGTGAGWLGAAIIGLVASGLTLVFGLMDVLNFGHGVFIALGAFMATSVMGWGAAAGWGGFASVFAAMLAATEAGYEVGTRTAVDVLDARRRLYDAQTNYLGSRYDYLVNVLRLGLAAGMLDGGSITELNGWLRNPVAVN